METALAEDGEALFIHSAERNGMTSGERCKFDGADDAQRCPVWM